MKTHACEDCRLRKPDDGFYWYRKTRDRLCRVCRNLTARANRDPEKRRAMLARWRLKMRAAGRCTTCAQKLPGARARLARERAAQYAPVEKA